MCIIYILYWNRIKICSKFLSYICSSTNILSFEFNTPVREDQRPGNGKKRFTLLDLRVSDINAGAMHPWRAVCHHSWFDTVKPNIVHFLQINCKLGY